MNHHLKAFSAALLTLCTITACNSDKATVTNTQPTTAMAAYNGNWSTGCVASPLLDINNTYLTYEFTADETTWQFVQSAYLDESCSIQIQGTEETDISERGTTTASGTYTDIGQVTTTDGLLANNLRLPSIFSLTH